MDSTVKTHYLGAEKISKLMLKFSVPCVLSLMVGAFYNIVDQIFIGNSELSTLGNAATGVVFPVFILAQAFAWCFSNGCATYLNICQGRSDTENAHRAVGTCITLTLLVSFVLMGIIFPFKTDLLLFFGASSSNLGLATEYLNIILAFLPALLFSNMVMSIISADGSPTFSMVALLLGAVTNIILDPIFIFGFKWGMTGAALATVLGQIASCIVSLVYFHRPKTFALRKESFIPHWNVFSQMLKFGFATFVTQITLLIITVLCNTILVKYGSASHYGADIPIAVIGIATKVFTIVINIIVGIVLGCQPIISYNMGAEKYDRVKRLYTSILLCTIVISLAFTFLFQFAPNFVIGLFGTPSNIPNPEDYWVFSEKTLRIYLMLLTFTCIVKMNSIFFQAAGKPIYALVSSVVRDLICFAPLIIILPQFMGIEGVLYAAPISDLISLIVTAFFTASFIRLLHLPSDAAAK